jgi:RHS repeat-associated protein
MTETYRYDKYGNISKLETALAQPTGSSINLLTTTTDYSYDANNRLTLMQYSEGEADYSVNTRTDLTYDKEGNLTEKSKWNESRMYGGSKGETDYYTYNGFNQLAEFEKDTGLAQNETYYYYYNAEGLRAKKVKEDNGAALGRSQDLSGIATQLSSPKDAFTTNYYYNGGKLVLETDGQGMTTVKTLQGIHLIKREVMNVQGLGLSQTQGGSGGIPASSIDKNGNMTYFYVQNSRGDVIKLLNENGDIIRDYEYEPFGKEEDIKTDGFGADYFSAKWKQEVEDNAIGNPFRFGGEYCDFETNNYYLRARYYDPEIQRFTQEDTYPGSLSNPMSQNGYAFCGNNPVNFIDPTGYLTQKQVDAKVAAAQKAYKNATTQAGRDAAHAAAEKARASLDGGGYSGGADGSQRTALPKSTSSGGSSGGNSKSVSATVTRNGQTLNATITDGVTTLADGSRPKVGDVVHVGFNKGVKDYTMTAKGGVLTGVRLNVPWETQFIPRKDFYPPKAQIGNPVRSLCAIASESMVANYYSPGITTTVKLYEAQLAKGGDRDAEFSNLGIYTGLNLTNKIYTSNILANIKSAIDAGKPAIVQIQKSGGGYHFAVVNGYTNSGGSSNNFLVKDPASQSNKTIDDVLKQYDANLYKAIIFTNNK